MASVLHERSEQRRSDRAGYASQPLLELQPAKCRSWQQRLIDRGEGRALGVLTLFTVTLSVLFTFPLAYFFGMRGKALLAATCIGLIVPLVVTPLGSLQGIRQAIELNRLQQELQYLATHDALTGAYNRRYFMAQLENEVHRAQGGGAPLAMLMIDADCFKAINDNHGHNAGDRVIEAISRTIGGLMRANDVFARYGGEEFSVLLPDTSLEGACDIAERVRSTMAALPVTIAEEQAIPVTVSIGVGVLTGSAETMLSHADAALYEAKRNGRNRWAC